MSEIVGLFNYWAVVVLMMVGFYTLIARGNLVKKLIGLNIFQTSVIMMYVSFGKITGGTAPILIESGDHGEAAEHVLYSNPIPHVLMLTAIVVGVATLALGLSLVVRINEAYGTIEEDEINGRWIFRPVSQHLPALLVVVPMLMAAPLAALVGRWRIRNAPWVIAAGRLVVVPLRMLRSLLLQRVRAEGVINVTALGAAGRPRTGIEYRVDLASAFVALHRRAHLRPSRVHRTRGRASSRR